MSRGKNDPACSPAIGCLLGPNFWESRVIGLVPTHSVLSGGLSASVVVFVSVPRLGGARTQARLRMEATVNNNMSTTVQVLPSGSVVVFTCQCLGRANSYQNGNRLQRFASCQALRGRLSTRPVNVHAIACRRPMYPIARMKSTRIPKAHMLTRSHAEPDATGGGLFGGVPAAAGGLAAAFAGAPAAAGRTPAPGFPVFGAPRV